MKHLFALFSLILLLGCQGAVNSPDNNIPVLTSTLNTENMSVFSSQALGIQLHYPENWIVHGDEIFINIAEQESHFPWKDYSFVHPDYSIWIQPPYLSQKQKLSGSMSVTQVANVTKNIGSNDSIETIEPITQVDINGQDGATMLNSDVICHRYYVFLSLDKDNTAVLSSCGSQESVEEMKSILNAIALSIEPIND